MHEEMRTFGYLCPKCGKKWEAPIVADAHTVIPPAPTVNPAKAATVNPTVIPVQPVSKKKNILIPLLALFSVAILVIVLIISWGINPTSVSLKDSSLTMVEGETHKLSYTIMPSDANIKDVTWESSDEDVATVSSTGKVTAVAEGECTITVTTHNGLTDECDIVVKSAGPDFKEVYDACGCASPWAEVGSDGSYLSIDSNPYDWEDSGLAYPESYYAMIDIHEYLGLPESLMESMKGTSHNMGRQTETFTDLGIIVTWTYHPDEGMEVTYKLIND